MDIRILFCSLLALLLFVLGCGGTPTDPDEAKATKLPSGLKIYDVKVGNGPEAKLGDVVSFHYNGTLRDGRMFDSSRKQNKPFRMVLGETSVIKGWKEGVLGMKVGGTRKLYIPPELGYGTAAIGRVVPANSELLFEVDLMTAQPALIIEDKKVGAGREAISGDEVELNYTGRLTNGLEFDSSSKHGKALSVKLGTGSVIEGWERGLIGMKKGGQRTLTIAPELGYGEKGNGDIPPLATLIFDVEMVSIK